MAEQFEGAEKQKHIGCCKTGIQWNLALGARAVTQNQAGK